MIHEPDPGVLDVQKIGGQRFPDIVVSDDDFEVRECLCDNRKKGLLQQPRSIICGYADREERC